MGALVYYDHFWIATALSVASLLLLELKAGLEKLASRAAPEEILTFAKFLLLSAVILPALPNQEFGHFHINPFKTWLVVVAVSTISYGSYVLQKVTKESGGVVLTAFLGGAYSSTVTTVAMSRRAAREDRPHLFAGGILIASGMMYLRLAALLMLFNRQLGVMLAPACLVLAGLAIAIGWFWSRRPDAQASQIKREFEPSNPLELLAAFLFALFFLAMLVTTQLAVTYLGRAGVNILAAIMGVTDVDPFIMGMTQAAGTLTPLKVAAIAVLIAAASNNLIKGIYSYSLADRKTGMQSLSFLIGSGGGRPSSHCSGSESSRTSAGITSRNVRIVIDRCTFHGSCITHGGKMPVVGTKKGVIGILTGGGDVPGLNPAIRAVTIRAIREGYQVIGIRRGWGGLVDIIRDKDADNSDNFQLLSEDVVNRAGRTGGTFLHTSRTNPSKVSKGSVPPHLRDAFKAEKNDLTPEVLKNLEWLGIDYLIPIGGDDTLSYGVRLDQEGVKVVAIPKTMDNDVPGTDYCIGFSTCVTRTIQMANSLRTSAGSHERFLVLEVFGRYAGFTAMLPTMAGAANRCVIPEHKFNIERLTELLVDDRNKNPSRYSVVLVSEGAMFEGGEMVFAGETTDAFGHKKLGGIGDLVSEQLKEFSPKFNNGKTIDIINQKLGYLVRGGDPDAIDSIVPMAYGNLALDLILGRIHGRLVVLKNGRYDNMPIDVVTATKKMVNVKEHYNTAAPAPALQELRDEAAVHHDQRNRISIQPRNRSRCALCANLCVLCG